MLAKELFEEAIQPFAVGRRAWLFSGSRRDSEAGAMLRALLESAKAAGYEREVNETLPTVTIRDGIETLLPLGLTPELLKIPAPDL